MVGGLCLFFSFSRGQKGVGGPSEVEARKIGGQKGVGAMTSGLE